MSGTDTGNEHAVEGHRDPRRYVVIHNGGETRKDLVDADGQLIGLQDHPRARISRMGLAPLHVPRMG